MTGSTGVSRYVYLRNTDGSPKIGVGSGDIAVAFTWMYGGNFAALTAIYNPANSDPWCSPPSGYCGWVEVDSANAPGVYRLDLPDECWTGSQDQVIVYVTCSGSLNWCETIDMALSPPEVNVSTMSSGAGQTRVPVPISTGGYPQVDLEQINNYNAQSFYGVLPSLQAGWWGGGEISPATIVSGYTAGQKGDNGIYLLYCNNTQLTNDGPISALLTPDDIGSYLYFPAFGGKRIVNVQPAWGNYVIVTLEEPMLVGNLYSSYEAIWVLIPAPRPISQPTRIFGQVVADKTGPAGAWFVLQYTSRGPNGQAMNSNFWPTIAPGESGGLLHVPGCGTRRVLHANSLGSEGSYAYGNVQVDEPFGVDIAGAYFEYLPDTRYLHPQALNNIDTTAPMGVASNFREMLVAVWRRFYKTIVKDMNAGTIRTLADDNDNTLTTQSISNSAGVETQGDAS